MYDDDLKKISSVKEEDVNEGLAYIASMSTCRSSWSPHTLSIKDCHVI